MKAKIENFINKKNQEKNLFTPGPAIVVIPVGLAVLATEFIWAKKLLQKFKEKTSSISKSAKEVIKKNF